MQPNPQQANRRLVLRLLLVVIGMFVFAVGILPPMYDVICDITGLNGKTADTAANNPGQANEQAERLVTVQFLADNDPDMAWDFKPNVFSIKVHPGEIRKVDFFAHNPTGKKMVGQAIPSVSPGKASLYFKKTECFCLQNQTLASGESRDMPLIFYLDPSLPDDLNTITLAYRLYDITDKTTSDNELAQAALGMPN